MSLRSRPSRSSSARSRALPPHQIRIARATTMRLGRSTVTLRSAATCIAWGRRSRSVLRPTTTRPVARARVKSPSRSSGSRRRPGLIAMTVTRSCRSNKTDSTGTIQAAVGTRMRRTSDRGCRRWARPCRPSARSRANSTRIRIAVGPDPALPGTAEGLPAVAKSARSGKREAIAGSAASGTGSCADGRSSQVCGVLVVEPFNGSVVADRPRNASSV